MDKSGKNNFIVRAAKKEDVSAIYELIKELAVFEKCADSVKISAQQLEEDGFGEAPAYGCFVAENSSGNIIGFALYFLRYSTCLFLEDLYVKPNYRGSSIGKELVKEIAKVAKQKSLKRIDFHVLKWNPAKEFYRKLGAINATENEDFEIYRFFENAIQNLAQN